MAKKLISLLTAFLLLCAAPAPAPAAGGGTKDDGRAQAIQKLNDAGNGGVRYKGDGGQFFLSGKLSGRQTAGEAAALRFLRENRAVFGLGEAADELEAVRTVKDGGDTFVKFAQTAGGAVVDGGALTVHFDAGGVIRSVNGRIVPDTAATALGKRRISAAEAMDIAGRQFMFDSLRSEPTAQRVIIAKDGKNYETYKVNISYTAPDIGNYDVYVEATSGAVLRTDDRVRYDGKTTGTGVDVTGKTRGLNLYLTGGSYQMKDYARPAASSIRTWDCMHGLDPWGAPIVQNATNYFNSEYFKASVSAHYFAGQVVDFYKKLFNRNSLDGSGMAIDSYTHFYTRFNNAFWDGYEMVYGDGDGSLFTYMSGDLDVVAHEMTHGVVMYSCGLSGEYQTGALGESLSDTFGVLIETYSKYVANGKPWAFSTADWVAGDQIYTPRVSGDALRNLANPHNGSSPGRSAWQPDNMGEYVLTDEDYGGVHINSGIPNKASYLIAKSIGMEKTARIYYRAVTDYLNEYSDFLNARYCLEQSAADLYGEGANEAKAVSDAFYAVGVGQDPDNGDPYEPNDTMRTAYEVYPGEVFRSYIASDADIDWYRLSVYAAGNIRADLTDIPDDASTDCDYDLYMYDSNGEEVDNSLQDGRTPESVGFAAPGPGVYYLRVVPYKSAHAALPACSMTQMYSLAVTAPGETVAGVSLDRESARLSPGETLALQAAVSPAGAANQHVAWSSSNTAVATVDRRGNVKAKALGAATITVTTWEGGFKATCEVTVAVPVTGVSLNKHASGQLAGGTEKFTAQIAPQNATDRKVTWSTSDAAVASVDGAGVVTAVSPGAAVITATARDGGFTDSCKFTVAKELLAPPSLKAAPAYNGVTLSWGVVWGASAYDVYRASSASGKYTKIGSTAGLSFTNGGLATGVTWYYRVVARRDGTPAMYGPLTLPVSAKTAPAAPPSFSAVRASYASIRVSWRASAGATKYVLYRSASAKGPFTQIAITTSLGYTDSAVRTGAAYYYMARAYRLVGGAKVFGPFTPVVSAKASLAAPSSVRAARASASSVRVTWGAVSGGSGYEVWRSTSSGGAYTLAGTTTSTAFTSTRLTTGRTYYFKVRAYRTVNGGKVYSDFSAAASARP